VFFLCKYFAWVNIIKKIAFSNVLYFFQRLKGVFQNF
jgi:hypothetical protein